MKSPHSPPAPPTSRRDFRGCPHRCPTRARAAPSSSSWTRGPKHRSSARHSAKWDGAPRRRSTGGSDSRSLRGRTDIREGWKSVRGRRPSRPMATPTPTPTERCPPRRDRATAAASQDGARSPLSPAAAEEFGGARPRSVGAPKERPWKWHQVRPSSATVRRQATVEPGRIWQAAGLRRRRRCGGPEESSFRSRMAAKAGRAARVSATERTPPPRRASSSQTTRPSPAPPRRCVRSLPRRTEHTVFPW